LGFNKRKFCACKFFFEGGGRRRGRRKKWLFYLTSLSPPNPSVFPQSSALLDEK
jgi:hypothetical protein